jgi:hypothetical protein
MDEEILLNKNFLLYVSIHNGTDINSARNGNLEEPV